MNTSSQSSRKQNTKFLWSFLFLLIALASVWVVMTQAKDFSLKHFLEYIRQTRLRWLLAAFGSMLLYIAFDALIVRCMLKDFGYHRSFFKCVSYAAADIYFSAITPSATGGQPMEAYFMVKDGIPAAISTVVMLSYLLLYTISIVVVGLLSLILIPSSFLAFTRLSRFFILLGVAAQVMLALGYGMLLWNKNLLRKILNWGLKLLVRLHIVRNPERHENRLQRTMDQYAQATVLLKGRRRVLMRAMLLNLAHRCSQILVTVFCFLAGGGALRLAPKLFAIQANVVMGAYCFPIPGSMGATDLLMLDGFSSLMSEQQSANLEILSRFTSFYICVLLCGTLVLIKYALLRLRKNRV